MQYSWLRVHKLGKQINTIYRLSSATFVKFKTLFCPSVRDS